MFQNDMKRKMKASMEKVQKAIETGNTQSIRNLWSLWISRFVHTIILTDQHQRKRIQRKEKAVKLTVRSK